MSTCIKWFQPGLLCLLATVDAAAATEGTPTPYGRVSLPFVLHKVPDAPVYINYVRNAMRKAVVDFVPFDEAYKATD
jgi:hypothetical protein